MCKPHLTALFTFCAIASIILGCWYLAPLFVVIIACLWLYCNPTHCEFDFIVPDMKRSKGIQKIGGFSRGWHHWNSIRLGCNRTAGDKVRLHLYAYVKGKQKSKLIGYFEPGEVVNVELNWGATWIKAAVNHNVATLYNGNNALKFGYLLNSYAELDGPKNEQIPFKVDIKNLKVNGKMIKIK